MSVTPRNCLKPCSLTRGNSLAAKPAMNANYSSSAARHTVALVVTVGVHPMWTDIGIFVATGVGVIVTFAAVLVALFGPGLRRSRRRPIVTLTSPEPWIKIDLTDPDPADPASLVLMRLTLHNKRGRDTCRTSVE
jgi:hypothetical protein